LEVQKELKPSVIIAPDNFLEPDKNSDLFFNFIDRFGGSSLIMGVPHGNSYYEYSNNYLELGIIADIIGVSVHNFMERHLLIDLLERESKIFCLKHHHLLGCLRPQEFLKYDLSKREYLKSLDTSNPVVHGFYGFKYTAEGLDFKLKDNIDSIIESIVTLEDAVSIYNNIKIFKSFLI
jgi:hypothetical protein